MLKPKPRGQVTVNDEPALMNGSVVRTAHEHQVCGAVIHAFGAWAKMMDITVAIAATRNHAAPIATPDQTSHLGRNVLRGARSSRNLTPMGAKVEPLRVAVCHGDNIWRDRNGLARRVDRALAAAGANGDGNLVIGSTRIFRSAKNASRHREQERIVIEGFASLALLRLCAVGEARSHLNQQH